MIQESGPVLRLIGGLRVRGKDWDVPQFARLFKRLGAIASPGVTGYVGYHGRAGGRTEVRFFGIQAESVGQIPRGMVALELGEDSITVLRPARTGATVVWHGRPDLELD